MLGLSTCNVDGAGGQKRNTRYARAAIPAARGSTTMRDHPAVSPPHTLSVRNVIFLSVAPSLMWPSPSLLALPCSTTPPCFTRCPTGSQSPCCKHSTIKAPPEHRPSFLACQSRVARFQLRFRRRRRRAVKKPRQTRKHHNRNPSSPPKIASIRERWRSVETVDCYGNERRMYIPLCELLLQLFAARSRGARPRHAMQSLTRSRTITS
ncbi:hypothetical protein IWZ00DRAFT_157681 [Phyllosticta capitalensis]|uniref:uncharacterized protein n=1 Tax=Phyllosticta capitalensis TaxID=121624 RepID=UPI003131AFF1